MHSLTELCDEYIPHVLPVKVGGLDLSVHELQPQAVEARLRAGKKTPNLGRNMFLCFYK